ncbi:hypothetical protein HK102_013999 [Quaeritorhiza haematococci]|nr:hypothetical protein HK102_013999 [Quaeritorhiza haematococci]
MIPKTEYPILHQQFFNITINNTINNYGTGSEITCSNEFQKDNILILDDTECNKLLLAALSGTTTRLTKFVDRLYGSGFACCNKTWYYFNDKKGLWEKDPAEINIRNILMSEEFLLLFGVAKSAFKASGCVVGKERKLKHIDGVITKLETASYKNGLIDDLGTLVGMRSKNFVQDLDKKRWLLAFNNGVYDLAADVFRKAEPSDMLSISTGYDYDPGCTEHQDRILDFLCKVFPDPDVCEYTLRYLASCLAGYTRNQLAFFGYGRGANGKSKLLSLMKETLGDYTFAMKHKMITGKTNSDPNAATPMLMALVGKRFVYVLENVDGRAINECTFKTFSGGDTTSGRGLYGAPATMRMDFKLFFVCNHLPKFNARDNAMVRRIKVILFVSTCVAPHVPERPKDHIYRGDPTLDDEVFATWCAGFMNMLLDCYRRYKEHNLGPTPAAVDLATTDYKTDNDAYQLFLDERTVPVAKDDKDAWIQPSVFYGHFKSWCRERGYREKDALEKDYHREFKDRGMTIERRSNRGQSAQWIVGWKVTM